MEWTCQYKQHKSKSQLYCQCYYDDVISLFLFLFLSLSLCLPRRVHLTYNKAAAFVFALKAPSRPNKFDFLARCKTFVAKSKVKKIHSPRKQKLTRYLDWTKWCLVSWIGKRTWQRPHVALSFFANSAPPPLPSHAMFTFSFYLSHTHTFSLSLSLSLSLKHMYACPHTCTRLFSGVVHSSPHFPPKQTQKENL